MTAPIMKPLKAFRVGEPIPKTEEKLRGEEIPLYDSPAPKATQKLKRTVGRTVLPRSSYRTTHDHAARTTTLIQLVEDHEIKRFPAVPGILSLRKALTVNNIFSRKHPLVRNA